MPASSPPAPPSRWPVMDLVALTLSLLAQRVLAKDHLDGPRLIAVARRRRGGVGIHVVDLPGAMPASLSAAFMLRCAPSPSGAMPVMW